MAAQFEADTGVYAQGPFYQVPLDSYILLTYWNSSAIAA